MVGDFESGNDVCSPSEVKWHWVSSPSEIHGQVAEDGFEKRPQSFVLLCVDHGPCVQRVSMGLRFLGHELIPVLPVWQHRWGYGMVPPCAVERIPLCQSYVQPLFCL